MTEGAAQHAAAQQNAAQPKAAPVLVLATHNQGKLRELRELLRGQVPGLDVDTQVVDAGAEAAGA